MRQGSLVSAYHTWRQAIAALDPAAATATRGFPESADLPEMGPEVVRDSVAKLQLVLEDVRWLESVSLEGNAKADLALLRARAEADLVEWAELRRAERDASWSTRVARQAFEVEAQRTSASTDLLSRKLRDLPRYLTAARAMLRFPSRQHVVAADGEAQSLAAALERAVSGAFAASAPGIREGAEAARRAIEDHRSWIRDQRDLEPLGHHSIGRTILQKWLSAEAGEEVSTRELAALAEEELGAARKRLEALATAMVPDAISVEQALEMALERLDAARPRSEEEVPGTADAALASARALANSVITVPLGVPAFARATALPGASYELLGAPSAVNASFTVGLPPREMAPVRRGELYKALSAPRLTTAALREGTPGRALAAAIRSQFPEGLRRSVTSRAAEEGWPAYAAPMALREAGSSVEPLVQLAGILDELASAARALVVTRIHDGRMTLAEAAALFRERALLGRERAEREAQRCAVEPRCALEVLGKRRFEQIARELQRGAGRSARDVNDALVSLGALPPAALRDLLRPGR
ncbi:MAG: DUF885 family protein [Planctomycetes bacterium]|nr:DUF885 family protein [Planctomycetota bacterium]